MKRREKAWILVLCMVLAVTAATTATLAFLKDTDANRNTFTVGNVKIGLDETEGELDAESDDDRIIRDFEMPEPGAEIPKDPIVTVRADSVDCWLYVRVTVSENFDNYLEYTMADGWVPLGEEYPGVWYYSHYIPTESVDQTFPVLRDNVVRVRADLPEQELQYFAEAELPTMEITAYAIQYAGFEESPQTAWQLVMGE